MLTLTDPEQENIVLDKDYEEAMNEYYEESLSHYNQLWWKALRMAIKERCKEEDNYHLAWWQQILLTIKFYICMIMDWKWKPEYKHDDVKVCYVTSTTWYGGWDVEYFTVGYGLFRNWWYRFETDGDCNM